MNPEQRLRLGLRRLNTGGFSWRKIGKVIGKSGGQAWFIAHGETRLNEQEAERMIAEIPDRYFWKGNAELDSLVLKMLRHGILFTGRELGRLLGTTDRNIRKSIKRLRKAGHNISASMKPPRGYRLED